MGFGLMMGFRRSGTESDSFNIAIGYIVDRDVQTLGDDIIANEELPEGETEVRYIKTSVGTPILMVSFSF